MIEIHGQKITLFNLYKSQKQNSDRDGNLEMEVDEKNKVVVKKFPYELAENNYNVYNLFSPNFEFYIDWCHKKETFMVITSKNNKTKNIVYRFG